MLPMFEKLEPVFCDETSEGWLEKEGRKAGTIWADVIGSTLTEEDEVSS